jgi:hypothetical protein
LVAAEADDHKMANMIPIQMNFSRMYLNYNRKY